MALLKSAHGGNIREAAALLGIAPGELLDFSANINPLGMPASLRQAIVDNPGCAERYPDVEYQQLHQALAAHHQLPAAHILAGNGETESIFTLVHGLKPRRAMIVIPGFAEYRRALQTVDCEVVEYDPAGARWLAADRRDPRCPDSGAGLPVSLHPEQPHRPAAGAGPAGSHCAALPGAEHQPDPR